MKNKIVGVAEAAAIIRDGDTVACSGVVGSGTPEALIAALEQRFLATGAPKDLTLVFAAAPGDGKEQGLNRLAHPGLVKRAIGGHWGLVPKLARMAVDGEIEAYNLPLGTLSQLFRDIAGRRGHLTKVGMRTFVDPQAAAGSTPGRRRISSSCSPSTARSGFSTRRFRWR
jgi:propionate CoA-transferase